MTSDIGASGALLTRAEGLRRLDEFAEHAGRAYAAGRNFDAGPGHHHAVSRLSGYIRRRLVSEEEVIKAVLRRHRFQDCEKFISEIFWRTYFKGWLEARPSIWDDWLAAVANTHSTEAAPSQIACVESWADELEQTGYLHNHARMWFASVWIFTLGRSWQQGARLFLRWLHDGDPASNTLSWRWVGGLHTLGKHYLARAENIDRFTNGRFCPYGQLNEAAPPLAGTAHPPPRPHASPAQPPHNPYILLLTAEDCHPESLPLVRRPSAVVVLPCDFGNMLLAGDQYLREPHIDMLDRCALQDAGRRAGAFFDCPVYDLDTSDAGRAGNHCRTVTPDFDAIARAVAGCADKYGASHLAAAYLPQGPWRANTERLLGHSCVAALSCSQILRPYDQKCWPHTTRGFFALRQKIPGIVAAMGAV